MAADNKKPQKKLSEMTAEEENLLLIMGEWDNQKIRAAEKAKADAANIDPSTGAPRKKAERQIHFQRSLNPQPAPFPFHEDDVVYKDDPDLPPEVAEMLREEDELRAKRKAAAAKKQ